MMMEKKADLRTLIRLYVNGNGNNYKREWIGLQRRLEKMDREARRKLEREFENILKELGNHLEVIL